MKLKGILNLQNITNLIDLSTGYELQDNDKVFIISLNSTFNYLKNSTATQNGSTIIKSTNYNGRWIKIEESKWLDYMVGNTSTSTIETPETITIEGSDCAGISSEIIYKGTTYKRFDLNDDSQSYVLTLTNQIIIKRY